jgi:hypothetical protein
MNTVKVVSVCSSACFTSETSERMSIKSNIQVKVEGVPLHAMEANGGRGGIAPHHT